jgi:hypothetical protein
MATAIELITRSLRLIQSYGTGETVDADDSTDALVTLNAMLDEWANEHLMLNVSTLNSIALSALASYTLGPTGSTVTTRPVSVDAGSFVNYSGVDYPLQIITLDQYNEIPVKTLSGLPQFLYFSPGYPDATVTLYPVPTAGMTLKLYSWKPLANIVGLTDDMILPPGYANAIVWNLAEQLANEYGKDIHISIHTRAANTKRKLKRTNYTPILLDIPDVPRGRPFNIQTGY